MVLLGVWIFLYVSFAYTTNVLNKKLSDMRCKEIAMDNPQTMEMIEAELMELNLAYTKRYDEENKRIVPYLFNAIFNEIYLTDQGITIIIETSYTDESNQRISVVHIGPVINGYSKEMTGLMVSIDQDSSEDIGSL